MTRPTSSTRANPSGTLRSAFHFGSSGTFLPVEGIDAP